MEEKERYKYFDGSKNIDKCIFIDGQSDDYIDNLGEACNLLNQQDKRIKELEKQLSKDFTLGEYIRLEQETQQLKQQLEAKEKRIHEVENTFNVNSIALADKFKKIKELKLKLAESKEENKKLVKALNGDIFINYKVPMENAKLKQQLQDLPKKIVEEIRKEIEFPLYVHPDFDEFECLFDIDKLLDTILKKYGEKDEN